MSRSRPKAASFSSLLLIIVMKGEVTSVVQFGVGPLFEAIAEDDDSAVLSYLQVQFDMPMSEDVVIPMVVLCFLVFGKEDEFFFVFSFVRAGIIEFFESASFRPVISKMVSPCRWKASEAELQEG